MDLDKSYTLATKIFDVLETRGTDAAGVWATEHKTGTIYYHKEPIKSSEFAETQFWKNLKNVDLDLMLLHARSASIGEGTPKDNRNNHPFVSSDKHIGLIHNGQILVADILRSKFETKSKTDSEVLLRIYEAAWGQLVDGLEELPIAVRQRLKGIQNIWSYVYNDAAMAVAIAERINQDERGLFLFHNKERPLWVLDLRTVLGQVLFISSPSVWYYALSESESIRKMLGGKEKLIEIPTNQIWYFGIDKNCPQVNDSNRFKISLDILENGEKWVDIPSSRIAEQKVNLPIVTYLNDDDGVVGKKRSKKPQSTGEVVDLFEIKSEDHEQMCSNIIELVDTICITLSNAIKEGSISASDYEGIMESLRQSEADLEGTARMVRV